MYLNFSSCLPYPSNENVLDFRFSSEPHKRRFRSSYADKVRSDRCCCKTGRHSTIGPPPRVGRPHPCNFLKKHSRQPPVFFDSEELKSHKQKDKSSLQLLPYRRNMYKQPNNKTKYPASSVSPCPYHDQSQRNMELLRNCVAPPFRLCNCAAANSYDRGSAYMNRNPITSSRTCGCGNCYSNNANKPNCSQRYPAAANNSSSCRPGANRNPLRKPRYLCRQQEQMCGYDNNAPPNIVKICLQPKFYVDQNGAYVFDLRPTNAADGGQGTNCNCKDKEKAQKDEEGAPLTFIAEDAPGLENLGKVNEDVREGQDEQQQTDDEAVQERRDSKTKRNAGEEESRNKRTSFDRNESGRIVKENVSQRSCCCGGVYLKQCNCGEKGNEISCDTFEKERRKSRNSQQMSESEDQKERRGSNSNYDSVDEYKEQRRPSNSSKPLGKTKSKRRRLSGSHLMTVPERLALIKGIQETRDKLNAEYIQLLSEDSKGTKTDQAKLTSLETKIENCENDLKILSSPKDVYVKTTIEDGQEVHLFHL